MILTHAALVSLALGCVSSPASVPLVVAIAEHELGGSTIALNRNRNGTVDAGLGQTNETNYPFLTALLNQPVNADTLRANPCLALRSTEAVLLLRYNGRPPVSVGVRYVQSITAKIRSADAAPNAPAPPPENDDLADEPDGFETIHHNGDDE